MNKVCLSGRITHDLDLRYTTSGKPVIKFNIAINRPKTSDGEQIADFPSIVVWGQQAENLSKYQNKGNLIAVVGRVQTRNYEDINGKKVYVTEILAENIEYLESKKKESSEPNYVNKTNYTAEEIDNIPMENDPFQQQMQIDESQLPW